MSFYSPYRWCIAIKCKNSTLKTPEKLFITVPKDVSVRYVWLELAGRDPTKYSEKSHLYLCEDHFDLEQDMENYMQYKIMGSVKKIRMKLNTTPSKFSHMPMASLSQGVEGTSTSVLPGLSTSFLEEGEEGDMYIDTSYKAKSVNSSQTAESTLLIIQPALLTAPLFKITTTDVPSASEVPEWPDDAELNSEYDDEEVKRTLYQPPVSVAFKKKKKKIAAIEEPFKEASGKEDAATAGSSRLHAGCRCDQCRGDIFGSRYCCVECPNYDMCGACEAAGHHATHYVLRVPSTKPHVEAIAVLENIRNVLLQREDAENKCDQEPEVKVEAPDPLGAAPDTSDEQEEKFAIDEPSPEDVPPSEERDILGDIVVKMELDEDQLMMESFQTVPEPEEYSHSLVRAAPVIKRNLKVCGGDGSRSASGRGSDSGSDTASGSDSSGSGSGEGFAARPATSVLQGSNVTQEKGKGTSSAKRKSNSPPQHAKVKKK